MISKKLLSEVLGINTFDIYIHKRLVTYSHEGINFDGTPFSKDENINIHELAHHKVKEWARLNNVFDRIEWANEPNEIFEKAEELRNEINK